MLEIHDIHTYYGKTMVLQGLSLQVEPGSVVAMLGRNGMGKTTTIRSIMGLTPPRHGTISYEGRSLVGRRPHEIARTGIGIVPQGRHIFPSLSVRENLWMPARNAKGPDAYDLNKVYELFPVLKDRAKLGGTVLSGGEQQMLCIARALMTNPSLLLMDEPSEGLSPLMVGRVGETCKQLRAAGLSILLVEQNVRLALDVADDVYIILGGKVVHHGTPAELKAHPEIQEQYLGVAVSEKGLEVALD